MKPDYFMVIDTETTQDNLVADFGAVVVNRKGKIVAKLAVLTLGIYNNSEKHPLFHLYGDSGDLWSKAGLPKRYESYNRMLENGSRSLMPISGINNWLAEMSELYNPYVTAYNWAFDKDKMQKTAIDLSMFPLKRRFCLWHASVEIIAKSKAYRQFILDNHLFLPPTQLRNMSYSTNAENMARFVLGNPDYPNEPHTAIEDVIDYELPILLDVIKRKKQKWLNPPAWNWRNLQVKDWYQVK